MVDTSNDGRGGCDSAAVAMRIPARQRRFISFLLRLRSLAAPGQGTGFECVDLFSLGAYQMACIPPETGLLISSYPGTGVRPACPTRDRDHRTKTGPGDSGGAFGLPPATERARFARMRAHPAAGRALGVRRPRGQGKADPDRAHPALWSRSTPGRRRPVYRRAPCSGGYVAENIRKRPGSAVALRSVWDARLQIRAIRDLLETSGLAARVQRGCNTKVYRVKNAS
jgi:hypothetical protein